MNEIFDAKIN